MDSSETPAGRRRRGTMPERRQRETMPERRRRETMPERRQHTSVSYLSETIASFIGDFTEGAYARFGSFFDKNCPAAFDALVFETCSGMNGAAYLSGVLAVCFLTAVFFAAAAAFIAVFSAAVPSLFAAGENGAGSLILRHPCAAVLISATAAELCVTFCGLAYPTYAAAEKRRKIEKTLPECVSYLFALAASGLSPEKICFAAGDPETTDLYGTLRTEFAEIRRDVLFFGADIVTAVSRRAEKTVSPVFSDFLKGTASVLGTGSDFSAYLYEKKKEYTETRKNKRFKKMQNTDLYAELASVLFLGAPMFFLILLYLMTPLSGNRDGLTALLTYRVIPGTGVMFLILADVIDG